MPKLVYPIDCSDSPLEILDQALRVVRVLEYAEKKGLATEERSVSGRRQFLLVIPLDELNGVLDELLFANLLNPTQEVIGRPAAHVILHERFSTLTWVDEPD